MKFIEYTIHTTTEGSELISDIFWNYTNYGVTICDVNDIIALQKDKRTFWDYMDDDLAAPQSDVLVKCFLPVDIADENIRSINADLELLQERSAGFISLGTLETSRREIEGDDWIDVWKKHFRPIHIGGRVVVCPEWARASTKPRPCASNCCRNTCAREIPSSTSGAAAAFWAFPPSSWARSSRI